MQYCKQLLPPLNSFVMRKGALAPRQAGQRVKAVGPLSTEPGTLATEIEELLEQMEKSGGKVRECDAGGLSGHQVHDPDLRDGLAAVRGLTS
jgi:hypothetical protein